MVVGREGMEVGWGCWLVVVFGWLRMKLVMVVD
jgi:hypothetical protein